MSNPKFGLKLWSINYNLLNEARRLIREGVVHYIELTVVPGTEISYFQKIQASYIIHITSENWGVNISDEEKTNFNLKLINQNIEWANKLHAKYLILHPGYGLINNAIKFLHKINDKRILIENMPKVGINDEKMVGSTLGQMRRLLGDRFGFCLDFNHTIKAAIGFKKEYKRYIRDFLKLNPKVFHISDGSLKNEKDEHLNIGEGKYDFNFLADCIKKSQAKFISLETPRVNLSSLEEDCKNIRKLKEFLKK